MLVECGHCGAPLDIKEGQTYTTCAYCRHKSLSQHLHTVAKQTPPQWQPPREWRPPHYASASSDATLRYRSQGSVSVVWVVIVFTMIGVFTSVVFAIVGSMSTSSSVAVELPRESELIVEVGGNSTPPVDDAQHEALSEAMKRLQRLAESVGSGPVELPLERAPSDGPAGDAPSPGKPPPKAAPRVSPPSRELAWDVAHRIKGLGYENCFFQDMSPPQNGMFPLRYMVRVAFEKQRISSISVSGKTNRGPEGFRWKDSKKRDVPLTAANVKATESKVKSCVKSAARGLRMPDNSSKGTIAVDFTGVDLISASGS